MVGKLLLEPAVGSRHLVHPLPLPSIGGVSPLSDNFLCQRTDPGAASPGGGGRSTPQVFLFVGGSSLSSDVILVLRLVWRLHIVVITVSVKRQRERTQQLIDIVQTIIVT